jgi:hypothetical protein
MLPGNDFSGVFQKKLKQLQRLLLHSDFQTCSTHFAGSEVTETAKRA